MIKISDEKSNISAIIYGFMIMELSQSRDLPAILLNSDD